MKKFLFFVLVSLVCVSASINADEQGWDIPAWQDEETEEAQETVEEAGNTTVESKPSPESNAAPVKHENACLLDKKVIQGVVLSADAVLACWAIYAFFDLKSGEAAYDERYSALDPALHDTDETLARLKDDKDTKGLVSGLAAGIAAAAITYTVLDYLQLHIVFPAEVKAAALPGGLMLTAEIKF